MGLAGRERARQACDRAVVGSCAGGSGGGDHEADGDQPGDPQMLDPDHPLSDAAGVLSARG
jgi:hypothetical protein